MDLTSDFFAKLRKLAVTFENETSKLHSAFENLNSVDDDSDRTARGVRAYHALNCEVLNIKEQIQDEVAQQKTNLNEVSRFIKDCDDLQSKLSEDINVIKTYWGKYGYQPPKNDRIANDAADVSSKEVAVTKDENQLSDQLDEPSEDTGEVLTPEKLPAPPADPMRTPQLSDFGLSELQMKRALGREWCGEVPQMPKMILPQPAFNELASPTLAITPTRAINLLQKNEEKTKEHQQNLLEPPDIPLIENFEANDDLESPEPPVFCTPGLKIKKAHPAKTVTSPESPVCPDVLPSSPDVPAFQTPYVNRLLSKKQSERRPEPIKMKSDDNGQVSSAPPHGGAVAPKSSWEFTVAHLMVEDVAGCGTPEMPKLESNLGTSLKIRSAKMQNKFCNQEEPIVKALELDSLSPEFNLRSPCVRRDYEEPSTPEMPDLSSVTLDICKLVSQAQMKKSSCREKSPREKENTSPPQRFDRLSSVSEKEFQCLPDYLRLMTLNSLNQAVDNINRSIGKFKRDKTEFHIEELKQLINFGAKTRIYILCLSELKRMEHIPGSRNNSMYKLCTN